MVAAPPAVAPAMPVALRVVPAAAGVPAAVVPIAAPPAIVAPAPAAIAGPGGCWLLNKPLEHHDLGTCFTLPAEAAKLGNSALVMIDGEEATLRWLPAGTNLDEYTSARRAFLALDKRTLAPAVSGEVRQIPEFISEMTEEKSTLAYPLSGPNPTPWLLEQMTNLGQHSFITRHHRWRQESGVRKTLPLLFEHEAINQALDYAISHDRLNLKNLLCIDVLVRRLMVHENAVSEDPENPSYTGARHFMGSGENRGGALVAPSLRAHVASELAKESAIMTENARPRRQKLPEAEAAEIRGAGGVAETLSRGMMLDYNPIREGAPGSGTFGIGAQGKVVSPPCFAYKAAWPTRVQPSRKPADGIFPIPPLPPKVVSVGASTHAKRRCAKRHKTFVMANEAIDCLSELYGCSQWYSTAQPPSEWSVCHLSIHSNIVEASNFFASESVEKPRAAARQLLGKRLDYDRAESTVAPFQESLVSLPEGRLKPVPLASVLDKDTREAMKPSHMLADDDVVQYRLKHFPISCYTDVTLKQKMRKRLSFYSMLASRGILSVANDPASFATPFFVRKKLGKQRLVLDCRHTIHFFRRPPPVPNLVPGKLLVEWSALPMSVGTSLSAKRI